METIKIDAPEMEVVSGHPGLKLAGKLIRNGQLVAFPTETVYGLGADARQSDAVARIFAAKGRPQDNPLIVHIADRQQLDEWVLSVPDEAERLMNLFWPGPLSIVLPVKKGILSDRVTAGLSTVAVRMPDHPAALELIRAANCPIAAPSANRSGRPSPTRAEHVLDDLAGEIAAIVDGGPTGIGLESTVVAVNNGQIEILRPGDITADQLREAGFTVADQSLLETDLQSAGEFIESPKSPGMKYKHYAPKGRLVLVEGLYTTAGVDRVIQRIQQLIHDTKRDGQRAGVLTFDEHVNRYEADVVASLGPAQDEKTIARHLYAALRTFDDEQIEFIAAEFYPETLGWDSALTNRMLKAAGYRRMIADTN